MEPADHRNGVLRVDARIPPAAAAATVHPDGSTDEFGNLSRLRFHDMRLLLDRAGYRQHALAPHAVAAAMNDTTLRKELLASGAISEEMLYRAFARELRLPYEHVVPAERLLLRESAVALALRTAGSLTMALAESSGARSVVYAAPVILDVGKALELLDRHRDLRERMRITTPTAMRRAVLTRMRSAFLDRAVSGLFTSRPDMSARSTASAWQGALVGAMAVGLPTALLLWPVATVFFLHLSFSLFFLAGAGLRLAAAASAQPVAPTPLSADSVGQKETYSVLVALYKEAQIVPDLLNTLGQLVWPRSRLEVKLICEEDDVETLAALNAHAPRPWVEVVLVPSAAPRTKPKALNFGLQLCTGDFVVIYDAEDRPDPLQLVEARRKFAKSPPRVACLQAPLEIANPEAGFLSGLFAMEYRALFHGLLPWLARRNCVIPLGGTSNHFRRAAIDDVMAWDAYNVTEDADLGLKLYRLGYRVDMLTRPTFEDAPVDFQVWLRQRTRWLKGWMQTWLVHMRNPFYLLHEIKLFPFIVSQILFAGVFISALMHIFISFFIAYIISKFFIFDELGLVNKILLALDTLSVLTGYGALAMLAFRSAPAKERAGYLRKSVLLPVYWTLLSLAAWRGLWQLIRAPHYWEKTPHKSYTASAPADDGNPRRAA